MIGRLLAVLVWTVITAAVASIAAHFSPAHGESIGWTGGLLCGWVNSILILWRTAP